MNDTAPFKFRAASNGKIFTRRERENIIESRHHGEKVRAAGNELIALERAKLAREKENRVQLAKVRHAQIENPSAKIKTKKDGTKYFQPRENGRLTTAVIVAKVA
jgi:hypothetical protein